jgi:hypothetical protein
MRHDATDSPTRRGGMPQVMRRPPASLVFMVPGTPAAGRSLAEQRVSASWTMPARLEAWLRVASSDHPSGPTLSLQASLVIPGLRARVTLRHDPAAGARPEHETWVVPMVPCGERITRASQPMHGLVTPTRVTLAVMDADGRPLAAERGVDARDHGIVDLSLACLVEASAVAWVSGVDWSEHRGPRLRVNGELVFARGVSLRAGFETRAGARTCELTLARPGLALYAPEKTLQGASPSSTWVSVRFEDGGGRPLGDEHVIGRCAVVQA